MSVIKETIERRICDFCLAVRGPFVAFEIETSDGTYELDACGDCATPVSALLDRLDHGCSVMAWRMREPTP